MSKIVLFNKPYGVLCQFTGNPGESTLADFVDIPRVYAAGRLDKDSEGLVVLTDDGRLQAQISHPGYKAPKTYWVQVEGNITDSALLALSSGVELKDGLTRPAYAEPIEPPLPPRDPPIRFRKTVPDSWLSLTLTEGKNRQVRRMTASVGFPTLRLYRYRVGDWTADGLEPGEFSVTEL